MHAGRPQRIGGHRIDVRMHLRFQFNRLRARDCSVLQVAGITTNILSVGICSMMMVLCTQAQNLLSKNVSGGLLAGE
jgi:hypothetical protein